MASKPEDTTQLHSELDRLTQLVRDVAQGRDRGAISYGDIADIQKEIERIDAELARRARDKVN